MSIMSMSAEYLEAARTLMSIVSMSAECLEAARISHEQRVYVCG